MKATTALPAPALSYKSRVKKLLIMGIIYLTSDKFSTFVGVIAGLMSYIGVILDDNLLIAYGGIAFLIGFMPWATRQTLRDIRQDKLGINNDKW